MFVQVGNSDVDNAYWYGLTLHPTHILTDRGGDQDIPSPRTAYPVNSSAPGTDVWASAAAAFAMASFLYSPNTTYNATSSSSPPTSPSLANATYSSALLEHAVTLYRTANETSPMATFADSVPAVASAYGSSGWGESLALGALALALTTNDSAYYADAHQYYASYRLTGHNRPWNWDSHTPALYVLFAEASIARPGLAIGAGLDVNVTGWQNEAEAYFDRMLGGTMANARMTDGQWLQVAGAARLATYLRRSDLLGW